MSILTQQKYIVFILHGYVLTPKKYEEVEQSIKKVYPEADVHIPHLHLTRFSIAEPDEKVAEVLIKIDAEWDKVTDTIREGARFPKIIIIGHSTGSLLARKLYLAACGENKDAPLGKTLAGAEKPRPWAKHIHRIILLAGMNRGWTINPHLYTSTALEIRVGIFIGHIMRFLGFEPLAFKTRRGASFITQLRIQWISMLRHVAEKEVGNAVVIQLLGTKDDIVSPDDNIDILTGSKFIYLEVPASNHLTVLNMMKGKDAERRRIQLNKALSSSVEELKKEQVVPDDDFVIKEDPEVTDVIFVVHGIRDTGYWTQKIARRIKVEGDKEGKRKFAMETSTYGYFAMLPFLLPFVRRQKVEWLMDKYTENIVLYPNATRFSFVGHSNGTYLLAKALREYSMCKFENIVFAGSVVQKHFEWEKMIKEGKVNNVYNFIASSDWVVAIFPKAFQTLRLQDIGSAGFDGFSTDTKQTNCHVKLVRGGHGAAIEESYWDEITKFIVHGKLPRSNVVCKRSLFWTIVSMISPLPLLLLIAALFKGAFCIYDYSSGIWLYFFFFVYIIAVWKIITRI